MADETWNSGSLFGQYLSSLNYERDHKQVVATCTVCGGKYRPAGGACIHEHSAERKEKPGPWERSAKLLPEMYAAANARRAEASASRHYPLWDEGTHAAPRTHYGVVCGVCQEPWQPSHACIRQPTLAQVQELAAMGAVLRLMDELMERLAEELGVAAPASWETV